MLRGCLMDFGGLVYAEELLFFFSSRRRHTRYWRDWSSDVCSSDLLRVFGGRNLPSGAAQRALHDDYLAAFGFRSRSEERRVGKEGRSRWPRYQYKKKDKENRRMPR